MSWKAIAQSAIGTSHIKSELPCQDYGSYTVIDKNILIGAVADGAGSAKHSDLGSKLAVETTLDFLKQRMLNIIDRGESDLSKPMSESRAAKLFDNTLRSVLNRFGRELEEVYEYSLRDLSCTLLAFIATPDWIAAMQIGDGFIVMRSQSPNSDYQLLFSPAKGEYANQTTFVTSASASSELQVKVIAEPPKFIFASTDGLERMAIDFAAQQAHTPFFRPFEKSIEQNNSEEEEQDIIDWLNSRQVNSKTDDDKTILICLNDDPYTRTYDLQNVNVRENTNHITQAQIAKKKSVAQKQRSIPTRDKNHLASIIFQTSIFGFISSLFLQFIHNVQSQNSSNKPIYILLLLITIFLMLTMNTGLSFLMIKNVTAKADKECFLMILAAMVTGIVLGIVFNSLISFLN